VIWPDIFSDNRAAILDVLDELMGALGRVRELVAADDRKELLAALEQARSARINLPARFPTAADLCEVRIPVPDRTGVVADVAILAADLDVNIVDLEIAHSTEGPQGVLVMLIASASADVFREGLLARGYRPAVLPIDG
jgi:prephenate dehydrogenase